MDFVTELTLVINKSVYIVIANILVTFLIFIVLLFIVQIIH